MASILPFSALTPNSNIDIVMYDTNMAVAHFGPPRGPRDVEARTFTANLAAAGVYIVTSIKLYEELRILAAKQLISRKPEVRKAILSANPNAIVAADQWASGVIAALQAYPNVYPEMVGTVTPDLLRTAQRLQVQYGLEWGDAVHLAIAYQEGLTCIATLDADYSRVNDPNLTIFTDSRNHAKIVKKLSASKRTGSP